MEATRDRVARVFGTAFGLLGAGLFLVLLFAIQWGADRVVLLASNWLLSSLCWLFGSK